MENKYKINEYYLDKEIGEVIQIIGFDKESKRVQYIVIGYSNNRGSLCDPIGTKSSFEFGSVRDEELILALKPYCTKLYKTLKGLTYEEN